MECVPSDKEKAEGTVNVQLPDASTSVVPKEMLLLNNSIVVLASSVPMKVGLLSEVKLSVLE